MALKLAGEEIGIQEKVETISYVSAKQDSGDLESATKTITATSKPATSDYTTSLTIPTLSDSRLVVKRLALRGNIHIDSFGGIPAATKLFCTVECNGVEKVSAAELNSAGADNFFAVDITTDFNVGSANELKVYLWVDQGEAVISVCQLWLGVGSCNNVPAPCLGINHKGLMEVTFHALRVGTGTMSFYLQHPADAPSWGNYMINQGGTDYRGFTLVLVNGATFATRAAVSTDIALLYDVTLVLRSIQ